ncbi:hypothetical protein SAMN05880574_1232 [Chryseobacterium sp. RU37D]|uniref:hypothetical protein n=1 Tax=Chryseobacterium sp. RU37D TaxID=1907397 RepID=UPI00095562C3|nr:hypothetical protein [Chryseobacterium sp. RU37D]SIQ73531.1 hypothetical protein SAMN05880574_1232 [Chryseobacterium sp. RU37D]
MKNPAIIEEINKIRKRKTFDFEKEWERGISIEKAKKNFRVYKILLYLLDYLKFSHTPKNIPLNSFITLIDEKYGYANKISS